MPLPLTGTQIVYTPLPACAFRRGHHRRAARNRPGHRRPGGGPGHRRGAGGYPGRGYRQGRAHRRRPGRCRVHRGAPQPDDRGRGGRRWGGGRARHRRHRGDGGRGGRRLGDRRGQGHRAGRGQPAAGPRARLPRYVRPRRAAPGRRAHHRRDRRGDERVRGGDRRAGTPQVLRRRRQHAAGRGDPGSGPDPGPAARRHRRDRDGRARRTPWSRTCPGAPTRGRTASPCRSSGWSRLTCRAPWPTARTGRRGPRCCWRRIWPGPPWPAPVLASATPSATRWAAGSASRTGPRSRWCCRRCSASTSPPAGTAWPMWRSPWARGTPAGTRPATPAAAIDAVTALRDSVGLTGTPGRLRHHRGGLTPQISADALDDEVLGNTPRMPDAADIAAILSPPPGDTGSRGVPGAGRWRRTPIGPAARGPPADGEAGR